MHIHSVISRLNFKYERTNKYIFNAHLQGLSNSYRMSARGALGVHISSCSGLSNPCTTSTNPVTDLHFDTKIMDAG